MTDKLQHASQQYLVTESKTSVGCLFDFSLARKFDEGQYCFLPGFCDVHVHFREPGFSYKETIKSGCDSASRGGYTAVCTMPNLNPVPDSVENILAQVEIINRDASVGVYPYGAITVGQKGERLADLVGINPYAIGFSDDGRGVQDEEMMIKAMEIAKSLNKPIVAHCEVNDLLFGGYIHDGDYAKRHGHRGICSQSEWKMIERDLALAKKTGASYHVCHVSAKESVELIRKAKSEGVDVTCETAPHYLILDDGDLIEDGRMKMDPPLRDKSDKI
ncbi:MAG: amidohydrolase family protein, partial [Clostridia bacterium]|nr:amidohydrolase family protein [Clostridia bacterium]